MTTAFTPGPWKVVGSHFDAVVPESTNALLADVNTGDPREAIDWDVVKANAALIAAAPDLYAALKNLIDIGPDYIGPEQDDLLAGSCCNSHNCEWCDARKALAKAEGVQP